MWGKGLMVMVLAVLVLLPGRLQAAEFDVSKFDKEVGLRFGTGKILTEPQSIFTACCPAGACFSRPRAKNGVHSEPRS